MVIAEEVTLSRRKTRRLRAKLGRPVVKEGQRPRRRLPHALRLPSHAQVRVVVLLL